MEILLLSYLGKKQLEKMEQEQQNQLSDTIVIDGSSTQYTQTMSQPTVQMAKPKSSLGATISFVTSSVINLVILIAALVLCYRRYKDKSTGVRIGMMVLAFFFPIIYLIIHCKGI